MDAESLANLIPEAELFALNNDRMRYKPYFERAEAFCAENGIVIGGKVGQSLLLGDPLTKDSFMWDLYCANPFDLAKKLVDALYLVKSNHVDNRTLVLQTNIKYREFTIKIDARFLFKIYALDKYREVSLTEIMEPVVVKGWYGSQVNVFPPAIVLIDLYQSLYSPSDSKLWLDLIAAESRVLQVEITSNDRTGAFDRAVADELLFRSLLKDERIVLIGDYACAKWGIGKGSRLQLLTDIPPNELCAMTSRILSSEKDQLRRVKVTHERVVHTKYNLNIPSDFQIIKYTAYAIVKGEQIALFDVFNSPAYEMIPYITRDKIKVAGLYVILRFIYIDIWILKLIIGLGKRKLGRCEESQSGMETNPIGMGNSLAEPDNLSTDITGSAESGLSSKINSLHSLAQSVRDKISATMKVDPFQVFLRDYIGVTTSETVAKKKIIANIGYRIPNYYPFTVLGE